MIFDYSKIPEALSWGSPDQPFPRSLRHLAEILNITYHLVDHPLFLEEEPFERIDVFQQAMAVPEMYQNFNRTIIERTIYQANHFSGIMVNETILTLSGKGIELALSSLKDHWFSLNKILKQPASEKKQNSVGIHYFCLQAAEVFDAQLKFFLTSTQELITEVLRAYISDQVKKLETLEAKFEFLIKWRGDMQKQEQQFTPNSYRSIMKLIDIELEVVDKLKPQISSLSGVENLVQSFLTTQKARISNDELLAALVEERYYDFQKGLEVLVMQLFSFHDITINEPEKVYHGFLLGLFNAFSGVYELRSNREAGLGRFDLMLKPFSVNDRGAIFEVKDRPLPTKLRSRNKLTKHRNRSEIINMLLTCWEKALTNGFHSPWSSAEKRYL